MGSGSPIDKPLLKTMQEKPDPAFRHWFEEEEPIATVAKPLPNHFHHATLESVPKTPERLIDGLRMEVDDECNDAFANISNGPAKIGGNINVQETFLQKKLYKLMEVRVDMQDLCFVDKVILHKQHIIALCNALLSAVEEQGGKVRTMMMKDNNDNEILQSLMHSKETVEVVGYYGDKKVMQQLLRQKVGIKNKLLDRGILHPGLYACLLYPVLHIFLWLPPSEDQQKEATRKDLACNFIRYLMDLCSTVHVCIPEFILTASELSAMQNNTKGKASRSIRTQRLEISRVKASNDDINISPGFSVSIHIMLNDSCSTDHNNYLLSKGSSRCALLFSSRCKESPQPVRRVENTTVDHLPQLVEQWMSSSSDVNFTRLPDEDFLELLKHADPESFQKYKEMCESLEDSIQQHHETEFYSEPAKQPRNCTVVLESLLLQTLCDSQKFMPQGWDEYCLTTAEHADVLSEQCIIDKFLPADFLPYFSKLEEQFLMQWTSQDFIDDELGLVFEGSRVQIVKAGTMEEVVFPECQDCGFHILSSSSLSSKKAPLQLGQLIRLTHKDMTVSHVSFTACDSGFPDGILLTGDTLQMAVQSRTIPVHLIRVQGHISVPGLLQWIDYLCQGKFRQFQTENSGVFPDACQNYYCSLPNYIFRETLIPMLEEKQKFENRMEQLKLEAEQKRSADEYLARLKKSMGRNTGHESTLSILEIKAKRKTKPMLQIWPWSGAQEKDELVLTVELDYAPRDILLWKAVELVPMSNDIKERLQHSSEHQQEKLFIPKASPESQLVVQLDSENERLLKCVLLKSSGVLIFVQDIESSSVIVHRIPRLGFGPNLDAKPITKIRRGSDIIAFDESSRTIVFYDKSSLTAQFYRFDEAYQHCDWIGVEINLSNFFGSASILWMELIPGKMEVVLIDDSWRVRVFEITPSAMMKPKHIQLPRPFVQAVISIDGSCLICLYAPPFTSSETELLAGASENCNMLLRVYLLRDSLSHLKDVPVTLSVSDFTKVDAHVVLFGSQMHLVLHFTESPNDILSLVLKVSSSSESIALKQVDRWKQSSTVDNDEITETEHGQSCPPLDYIFHIYDKFPTSPPLVDIWKGLHVTLLLAQTLAESKIAGTTATPVLSKEYVQTSLKKLSQKGKSFQNLKITFESYYLDDFLNSPLQVFRNDSAEFIGTWVNKLLSLVPIQIARAENNSLRPLVNGLEINSTLSCKDAVSMSNLFQYGFYDVILDSWQGNITVISSMGKQSSGKSYLLNHLTGSLYDVAGGRCTDGVWMTTRIGSNCLYILLDFEGLGSFERTDQEDMLLSLLSAALSNVTLFNKKDFHLDKEMELLFKRFQSGVSLVKEDPKLFKGLFYIAIKDVDNADVEDLKSEFVEKIERMCSKTTDNFLLKMYSGTVEIAAMAPFRSMDFQCSVQEIADVIQTVQSSYKSGRSFLCDMKLLISQICTKDWSPLDAKRAVLRIQLLRQQLKSAVRLGCLSLESGKKALTSLDTEDEVEELKLQVEGAAEFELPDAGLELYPFHPSTMLGSILEKLKCEFEKIQPRNGEKDEIWLSLFEIFLLALVERRKKRTFLWLECNSSDFSEDGDVQKLKLEANAALAELKEGLKPCSIKCTYCFLKCILDKGHPYDHSCKGSHVCTKFCGFCLREDKDASPEQCTDVSGHGGPHDCKKKSHTCGRICDLAASSSSCNSSCAFKVGHSGAHHCNSLQHRCKIVCAAPACKNTCIFPLELGEHDRHACHQTFCLMKCMMTSCTRSCATEDHFHALDPYSKHLCENKHLCQSMCQAQGICEVQTELVKQTGIYQGKRALFQYEYQSEQNGLRKGCCIVIPAFCDKHDGMHVHTSNRNAIHYCDKKCPSCGYFCNMPFGHAGLHETVHGNMTLTRFVSESKQIDIMDRKYEWGESGKAEMCMMHCTSRGRGHIHLIPCPAAEGGVCTSKLYDGARHETTNYGPDFHIPKDEMTHETYWRHVRFKDPCTKEEQKVFSLCDHYCRAEEHKSEIAGIPKSLSYCAEKLWHAPVSRVWGSSSGAGFVSDDGHYFCCNHTKDMPVSVIFVIDISGSMLSGDIRPTLAHLHAKFPNRLGCVYESILRFIQARLATVTDDTVAVVLFDNTATIAVPPQQMSSSIVNILSNNNEHEYGGTTYSAGLQKAEEVLNQIATNHWIRDKKPIVIFLSDGGNCGGTDPLVCINSMKQKHPNLIFHTIMFGNDDYADILKKMAKSGEGTYQCSLDEVQLARSFEGIALSLRSKTAVLMH